MFRIFLNSSQEPLVVSGVRNKKMEFKSIVVKINIAGYCCLFILLLVLALCSYRAYVQGSTLKRLQPIQIEIVSKDIISFTPSGNKVKYDGYRPRITFIYNLGGITYKSQQYWVSPVAIVRKKHEAERFIADYSIGQEIIGYYDQVDPSNGYLTDRFNYDDCILGMIAGAIAFFIYWFLLVLEQDNSRRVGLLRRLLLLGIWFMPGIGTLYCVVKYSQELNDWFILIFTTYFILGFVWANFLSYKTLLPQFILKIQRGK